MAEFVVNNFLFTDIEDSTKRWESGHCRQRRRRLLLDNCEHLIEAGAGLAERLLREAAQPGRFAILLQISKRRIRHA